MQFLIIPDIHHQTANADYWLRTQPHDQAVFLGDYFDNYGDTVADARRTALWLRERIENTNDIFLLGNHDLAYMFPDLPELFCPGFTHPKAKGIHEILEPKHWRRFRLTFVHEHWLMSHAGFSPFWLKERTLSKISGLGEQVLKCAKRHKIDPILIGDGFNQQEGLLWLRWQDFCPIDDVNQIVGHSPGGEIRQKMGRRSQNYCLDVRNGQAIALLSQNEITLRTMTISSISQPTYP